MEDKFLKNPLTGQIMRSNPSLAKRTDLKPCDPPRANESGEDTDTGEDTTLPDLEKDKALLSEEEGAALVHGWFGRDVGEVTVANLNEFAQEKGIEITGRLKKLELVTAISKALSQEV